MSIEFLPPRRRAKREPRDGDYNENGGRELQGTTCNICKTTFATYPQMNYHRRGRLADIDSESIYKL